MKYVYTIILLSILMGCNSEKNIDIQGHRGCRGLLPENSIPAFEKAVKLGVHTLELDVAVSKDNVVTVSHEPYISRFICLDAQGNDIPKADDKQYNLYQMTFDSIKQFDCGRKYFDRFPDQKKLRTYKPSLDEVIKSARALNPNIKFNVEIKARPEYDGIYTPYPKEFVQLVLDVIVVNDVFEATNLQSFDLRILEEIKKQVPTMKVALLVDGNESIDVKLKQLSFKPEIISPYFELLNSENIEEYQEKNYLIIPWTVNDEIDLQQMVDFQVDGIITDYPDRLIELLK